MSERLESGVLQRAIAVIEHGSLLEGLTLLEGDPSIREIPLASSYLAYCIAGTRGQHRQAIRMCQSALSTEPHNPAHYLNLGRIFLVSRHKGKAFAAFRQGLSEGFPPGGSAPASSPAADEGTQRALILTELRRMGIRKRAPFPFLPREHPLNRVVGKALSTLNLR